MTKRLFTTVVFALAATAAHAADPPLPSHNWITPPDRTSTSDRIAYIDGNKLFEYCRTNEFGCILYIQGVVDGQLAAVVATNRDVAYCIPMGSTAGQVKDVVMAFLTAHPERRHLMGGVIVANALSNAWPQCQ